MLEAWAGTSVYKQDLEVYHVSPDVDPADVVDQAREGHPKAAELAELVLDWMVRDTRWQHQNRSYHPMEEALVRATRAHDCVRKMLSEAVHV